MNKLWIFGDSYSTYNRERGTNPLSIYSDVAEYLNFEESNNSISGLSTSDIFANFLKFLPEYKSGDIIIFQFSFLNRISYIDQLEYRKLNAHEELLFSKGKTFFLHPQFYHSTKRKLDEFEIKKLSKYIEDFDDNMVDYYFKFLVNFKHIISFLEKLNIDVRLILLEDKNLKYNLFYSFQLKDLLIDLELKNRLIKFGEKEHLLEVPYYVEEDGYEHHHFSLETIKKYSEDIKQNFNEFKV